MKKLLVSFLGIIMGLTASAWAFDPSYISVENLLNKCFDSTNNALKATISGNVSGDTVTARTISCDTVLSVSGDVVSSGGAKFNDRGANKDFSVETANSATAFVVNSDATAGNEYVSTALPFYVSSVALDADTNVYGAINQYIQGNSNGVGPQLGLFTYGANIIGPQLHLLKTRSTSSTCDANTIVASGDRLGEITFTGADGARYRSAAYIYGEVDGTPGSADMPGRLTFWTSPDGSATPVENMRIDSVGNVLIGDTATKRHTGGTKSLEVSDNGLTALCINDYNTNASYAPVIELNRSKNATVGSHTVVAQNDILGYIAGAGSNGSSFSDAAYIEFAVDGAVTGGGAADMPGRIMFLTSPDGTATPSERMRIENDGAVLINGTTTYARNANQLFEVNTLSATGGLSLNNWSGTTAGYSPAVAFQRSRGTANGSYTAVVDGDSLGYLEFSGADATDFAVGAYLTANVDGTPGANDMPARLAFWTTPDGTQSPVERMRIDSTGKMTLPNGSILSIDTVLVGSMRITGDSANVADYTKNMVGKIQIVTKDGASPCYIPVFSQ